MSGGLDRDRRHHGDRDVPSRRRGQAAARRIRRQGRGGRRRDGRRHQQHAAGPRVLRSRATNTTASTPPSDRELDARGRSLRYLEKLRLLHAVVTIVLTIALLAWAIMLWQQRRRDHRRRGAGLYARTFDPECDARSCGGAGRRHPACRAPDRGDRDAAAAARVAGSSRGRAADPQRRRDRLQQRGVPLSRRGYRCSTSSRLRIQPGQRVGLVGQSGGGKSSLFALLQRFYDVQRGNVTIDGQDISRVTQQSLREAISVVPQDISLFHRSIMENIRYGRPNATDDEVLRAAIAARCDFIETLPEAWTPWSATAGSRCPADSGSASPSRAPS